LFLEPGPVIDVQPAAAAAAVPAAAASRLPSMPLRLRVLAGLQTGVVGGILMLLYFSTSSVLQRQQWWSVETLLGSAIYGNVAIWRGLGRATLAGACLQLFLAGAAGVLFALVLIPFRWGTLLRLAFALLFTTAWYLLFYNLVFPAIAPLIPLYSSRMAPVMAHLLLGISLWRLPAVLRQLS
jgi:hypothetical protein